MNWPVEQGAERACCVEHDRRYYYGGSAEQRLDADLFLYSCELQAGMNPIRAWLYYRAVRIFGAPFWLFNKKRWAHGTGFYQYD